MKYIVTRYFDYIAENIKVFDNKEEEPRNILRKLNRDGKIAFTRTLNLEKFQITQKYWKVNWLLKIKNGGITKNEL